MTAFETRARKLLEESVDHLDGRARSRLIQARSAAVAELADTSAFPRLRQRWWLPAGGIAAVALVIAVWFVPGRDPDPILQTDTYAGETILSVDDIEIMAAESLELLEELEFYAWLDSEAVVQPVTGSGTG